MRAPPSSRTLRTLLSGRGRDDLGVGERAHHLDRVVLDRRGAGGEIIRLSSLDAVEGAQQLVVLHEPGEARDADFNLSRKTNGFIFLELLKRSCNITAL